MPESISYRAFQVTLPLLRPIPVGGSLWSSRPVVLLMGRDEEGRMAWGEAAPLEGYGSDTLDEVIAALSHPSWKSGTVPPSLACALGTVRWGLDAIRHGTAFGAHLGTSSVEALTPAFLLDAPESVPEGVTHVKIKVGRESILGDIDRIRTVHESHPAMNIRLDGNGLLSPEEAGELVAGLGGARKAIDYFEEPWTACFQNDMRGALGVPVAMDESLHDQNWLHADVCILKPSLLGHPAAVVDLARQIQASGRRVVFSSAFESRVGMVMVTRLAALCGDAAPGLGTYRAVADDWGGRLSLWDNIPITADRIPSVPGESGSMIPPSGYSRTFETGLTVEELL